MRYRSRTLTINGQQNTTNIQQIKKKTYNRETTHTNNLINDQVKYTTSNNTTVTGDIDNTVTALSIGKSF